jgi:hypothetical protein
MFELQRWVEQKETLPLLNYMHRQISQYDLSNYQQIARKKRVMFLTLRTAELMGIILDIVGDIVDSGQFVPVGGKNGRNRVRNAKRWADSVKFKETLKSSVFDLLVTGEGYLYLGSDISKMIEAVLKASEEVQDKFYDENMLNPKFRHVASTTMIVRHDSHNIKGYEQNIGGSSQLYSPKEIIRLTFQKIDGRVEGYTPLYSIPLHLELLWLLWQNQFDLQLQGNMPDYFVVAEDLKPNSPSFTKLEQKLQAYNKPGNSKHGLMLLGDGKYNIEKMERDTSLQFSDTGKAVTSVIASLFQYPKGRLNIKTKEAADTKNSDGGDERSYWKTISQHQHDLELALNTQLFEPYFGVNWLFNRGYLHDEVVENTALQLKLNNLKQLNEMLQSAHKKTISQDYLLHAYNGKWVELSDDYLEEAPDTQIQVESNLNKQLPKSDVDNSMSPAERSRKRTDELARERTKGKPIGV